MPLSSRYPEWLRENLLGACTSELGYTPIWRYGELSMFANIPVQVGGVAHALIDCEQ